MLASAYNGDRHGEQCRGSSGKLVLSFFEMLRVCFFETVQLCVRQIRTSGRQTSGKSGPLRKASRPETASGLTPPRVSFTPCVLFSKVVALTFEILLYGMLPSRS
jgi:hypothetical protein